MEAWFLLKFLSFKNHLKYTFLLTILRRQALSRLKKAWLNCHCEGRLFLLFVKWSGTVAHNNENLLGREIESERTLSDKRLEKNR